MGQRDLGFLLVPIIALLAVFVPSLGSSKRAEAPPVSSAAVEASAAASDVSRRDAAALLQEYGSIPSANGTAATGGNLKAEACLIATLPDPVDAANLNYTYDRYLDAIQRAMEGAGYLLDRFDLPWLDPAGPPAAANAAEPRFRREPGRLLFRSRTRGDDPLPPAAFVFIVGETPTAGIHKAAFVHAVQEFSAVCANGQSEPIRILGPSFSGSATSLHALLRAFPAREFVMVSGSATAIESAELTRGVNAVFQTTIAQDIDARNRLLAAFDTLFALGFLAIYAGLAMSFVRFVYVWRKLLQLLRRLAWHPTVKAYARLREKIPGKPKINLTSPSQIFTALEFSIDRAGQLVGLARELIKSGTADQRFTLALQAAFPDLEYQVTRAEAALHAALNAETHGDWRRTVRERTRAERRLSLVGRTVTTLLRPAWRLPATDAPSRGKEKPDELDWFALGEDFLTSRVAAFLSHVVPQLQNLVIFVTAGLLLMLLAVTAYPFEPKQLLLFFNTTVILVVVSTTLVVFIQMERETILSVLSDSEPGQISWNRDFLSRVAVYVILPIISLLGAQFPEVAQQLFSWTSSFFGTH